MGLRPDLREEAVPAPGMSAEVGKGRRIAGEIGRVVSETDWGGRPGLPC